MKHRKLRIAWSVAWGIVAVLLIALWVRSYGQDEHILWNRRKSCFGTSLYPGEVTLELVNDRVLMPAGWSHVVLSHGNEEEYFKTTLGFAWRSDDDQIAAIIPFWFLTLSSAAFTASPWFKISNRLSLRTLLIATTLVAVGLGLVVWAAD